MAVTPQTIVYLCHVPLEIDQKNQLDFATASAQYTYFYGTRQKTYTSFTYQRKDNILRVPDEVDKLHNCNYVMYQNADFDATKWFYAFIESREYVNPNCTALKLKTDVWQTWMFEKTMKRSFVAREHVADDSLYHHILPEPITVGEYSYTLLDNWTFETGTPSQTVNTTWVYCAFAAAPNGQDTIRPATQSGGSYIDVSNSISVAHLRSNGYLFGSSDALVFKDMIEQLVHDNYDIIYTIALPYNSLTEFAAVKFGSGTFDPTVVYPFKVYADKVGDSDFGDFSITTTAIGSHTVRNNKVNCYPYRACVLTDDVAQTIDLKYEYLSTGTSRYYFHVKHAAGSDPALCCIPNSYKGKTNDLTHSLTLSSFPPVPYNINAYTQYIARHKSQFETSLFSDALSVAGGALSGAISGNGFALAGTMLNYMSGLAAYEDMQRAPGNTRGVSSGTSKFAFSALRFRIYDKYPAADYLEELDNFFDFYGYNVSSVKVPQWSSRTYWNYVETKEVNIDGNIPQEDMQELKSIFNNGVTVWHNPQYWCDYSQDNRASIR